MKTSGYIRHLIVCVVCSSSLFAQCENKGTTADVTECYEQEFRKADAELNRVYKQVLKDLDSEDAARLHKAQRGGFYIVMPNVMPNTRYGWRDRGDRLATCTAF